MCLAELYCYNDQERSRILGMEMAIHMRQKVREVMDKYESVIDEAKGSVCGLVDAVIEESKS